MKTFVHLDQLIPHVDDAFESFYNAMLNDVRLAVFFEDDTQIRNLIQKQKEHFTSSLSIRTNSLKEIYIKLGEYHYDLRIPYVDFIKGTDILEEHFLRNTQMHITSIELMDEIFEYFKLMKAFTAKGYLNRMLEEDKKDIDMFFVQTNLDKDTYLPRAIVLEKIEWLKELLVCIEEDKEFLVEPSQSLFAQWIKELDFLSLDKRMFFEDLEPQLSHIDSSKNTN